MDVVVIRHGSAGSAFLAQNISAAVINAGDGPRASTQALLDMFSILEAKGRLDNLEVAVIGDIMYIGLPVQIYGVFVDGATVKVLVLLL